MDWLRHKLISPLTRGLHGITAAKGLNVLQSLALIAVIGMVYVDFRLLNALLWIFLFCCLVNVRAAIEDITKNIAFIVLCLQYPLLHLFRINFVDELIPGVTVIPGLTAGVLTSPTWMWGGLVVLLSVPFFCGIRNLPRMVDVAIPPILILTFAALSYDHWHNEECRTAGLHRSLFNAPLVFTTLTVVYLRNIDVKTMAARRVAYALVVCSLVMSIFIAGTRGIAIAQILSYAACGLIFASTGSAGRWLALKLFASVVLGVFVGLALVTFSDCGANSLPRIVAPSSDVSAISRHDIYVKSLKLIAERPITGYGISFESIVAQPFRHAHNQYLSWMLWGGVISLASGIIFITASVWSNLDKLRQPSSLILIVALLGTWGVSNLFDSFLIAPSRFYLFIVYLCLVQVLLVREAEARQG